MAITVQPNVANRTGTIKTFRGEAQGLIDDTFPDIHDFILDHAAGKQKITRANSEAVQIKPLALKKWLPRTHHMNPGHQTAHPLKHLR